MCGGGKSGANQTTSSTAPDPAMKARYDALWNQANQVAQTPYQQYTGERVAEFTPDQQAAFQAVRNTQGVAQPYIATATDLARQGAAGITPDQIAAYQNPYMQSVVDATQRDLDVQNARAQSEVTGNAALRGALGSSRTGVAQALTAEGQARAQAPIMAQLRSSGFNTALGAAQADRSAAAQGAYTFGNLGNQAQATAYNDTGQLLNTGGMQMGREQAQLDVPYGYFQEARAYPYQNVNFLSGITNGIGSNYGSTTTQTTPRPNILNQILGLGVSGLGVASGLGWKPFAAADGGSVPMETLADAAGKMADGWRSKPAGRYAFGGSVAGVGYTPSGAPGMTSVPQTFDDGGSVYPDYNPATVQPFPSFVPPAANGMQITDAYSSSPAVEFPGEQSMEILPPAGGSQVPSAARSRVAQTVQPQVPAETSSSMALPLALIQGGAAMAASKSPYVGIAAGEGIGTGAQAYSSQAKQEASEKIKKKELEHKAAQLKQAAQHHADTLAETTRHHKVSESQGNISYVPGTQKDEAGNDVQGFWALDRRDPSKRQFIEGANLTAKGAGPTTLQKNVEWAAINFYDGDKKAAYEAMREAKVSPVARDNLIQKWSATLMNQGMKPDAALARAREIVSAAAGEPPAAAPAAAGTATPASAGKPLTPDVKSQFDAALKEGKPRDALIKRLQDQGYDVKGL